MASAFSHLAVPLALRLSSGASQLPRRLLALGLILSAAPDLDVIGFKFGIAYNSPWGHRGFTHSVAIALVVGAVAMGLSGFLRASRRETFGFCFVSTFSHGVLDALTNGGLGVAFFWPLTSQRYFFPYRPVEASPLSVAKFFTESGLQVLQNEAVYIWLPCGTLAMIAMIRRKMRTSSARAARATPDSPEN